MSPTEQQDAATTQADIVVIGAGTYGIRFARTYLEIHPDHDVIVLEADAHVGGPWASHRGYNSFMTQSPVDFIEFSDKPLSGIPSGELYYCHFPAKYYTNYLEEYIDEHVYAGKSLRSRINFCTRVQRVTKTDGLWHVLTESGSAFLTPKLVDAVGLTSVPKVPEINGRDTFRGVQLHHKDFGQSEILQQQDVRSVAVIGGAKSAADVAYAAAKAGKTVHWIIRKSGTGPSWFAPVYGLGGMATCSSHNLFVRLITPLLASVFAKQGPGSRFLYRSPLGQAIFWGFWHFVASMLSYLTDYDRKDGRANGFHNLKPETEPFWANDSAALVNVPDFLDTIAKHVQVYRQDVDAIGETSVELGNGAKLEIDAIVYATGWTANMSYLDPPLVSTLGLPMLEQAQDEKSQQHWKTLEQEAGVQIDAEMPMLSRRPSYWKPDTTRTPLRLYKSMLPIADRSVVFLGKTILAHNFAAAEVESLWAVAALDHRIELPSLSEMEREVAKTVAWSRKRYPSRGWLAMWLPWDTVPFTDMLLDQLGLVSHRGSSWWSDSLTVASSKKLGGLINEYQRVYQ
ncbi:hypothetical protein Q7P37_004854 [Cladosporium fusiforme]